MEDGHVYNSLTDKTIREQAKVLYFSDYSIEEICAKLNLDSFDLSRLIKGADGKNRGWARLKKQMNPAAIIAYMTEKRNVLEKTAGLALNILQKNLDRMNKQVTEDGEILSVKEMQMLSQLFSNIDKVIRLEDGRPTNISQHQGLTQEEARKILQSDPFAKIIEADVVAEEKIKNHPLRQLLTAGEEGEDVEMD